MTSLLDNDDGNASNGNHAAIGLTLDAEVVAIEAGRVSDGPPQSRIVFADQFKIRANP